MNELAQMTYNQFVERGNSGFKVTTDICGTLYRNDFVEIMEMLDKRLNDKGKNWRHVFKVSSFVRVS